MELRFSEAKSTVKDVTPLFFQTCSRWLSIHSLFPGLERGFY
jgi:hypothetical protein